MASRLKIVDALRRVAERRSIRLCHGSDRQLQPALDDRPQGHGGDDRVGIAMVVAVFVMTLAIAQGFRATLVASGSPQNAIVLRKGATVGERQRRAARRSCR